MKNLAEVNGIKANVWSVAGPNRIGKETGGREILAKFSNIVSFVR